MQSAMSPHSKAGAEHKPLVYIVDDEVSVRRSLAALLRAEGWSVEAFATPQAFLDFARPQTPSCLILDVRLPGTSGLAFHAQMREAGLYMPVLFVTGYGDMEMCAKALRAGALNFFPKPFRNQDIVAGVIEALTSDEKRLEAEREVALLRADFALLTSREQQVMAYVVAGLLNKQIAFELNLSEITVKIYRGQVMRKMKARSVPDLVRKAQALDLALPAHASR
ncbi:response regulator transcription factor [Paraburkholderia jirisanensis]